MPRRDIVVIGTSLGGVEALKALAAELPAELPAALFVVLHLPSGAESLLPQILNYRGRLPARHPEEGEAVRRGYIYVAPPDYHMLVHNGGVIRLSHGPRENRHRPAVDPLFRSAARAYGPRVVGVILTGMLYDGAAGLLAVRNAGGVAVVQDPSEAVAAGMPQAARDIAGADHVVPLAGIVPLLSRLAREPVLTEGAKTMTGPVDPIERMPEKVLRDRAAQERGERDGEPSVYGCPECGGVLWQVQGEKLLRFRCHVGHVYASEDLLAEQSEALEAALWICVRTFIEKASLARQMAATRRGQGHLAGVEALEEEAKQAERYAALIREHLLKVPAAAEAPG